MKNILTTLPEQMDKHNSLVLATILETSGSTPQAEGASALFSSAGLVDGTLGGGILEGDAQLRAAEVLKSGQAVIYEFSLDADISSAEGAICGGTARILLDVCRGNKQQVFRELTDSLEKRHPGVLVSLISSTDQGTLGVERKWVDGNTLEAAEFPEDLSFCRNEIKGCLAGTTVKYMDEGETCVFLQAAIPYPRLLIAGAGHIGRALAHLGNLLEFEVTVIDDRPEYSTKENIPDADYLIVSNIGEAISQQAISDDSYIVIVTHGHRDDAAALRNCIGSDAAYLGMIGSKTKIALMRKQFVEEGWATPEQLERLHAPIGLEIKSKTVQEIAISIAAQLVLVRQQLQQSVKRPLVCALVLAAGESKRMGSPKQLLPFGDTSIIETLIQNIGKSYVDHTIIVLGARYEEISEKISKYPVTISENRDYKKGMFTSVQQGLKDLPDQTGSIIVLLGDQPMISASLMDRLIDAHRHSDRGIAVASYKGKRGHPVMFDLKYRSEISGMGPDKSLRDFLGVHWDDVLEVELDSPEILRDIDTPEEYKEELKQL